MPWSVPRLTAVLVALAVGLASSACGTSGRELREPPPGATAPPRQQKSTGTVAASSTTLGTVFALTTDAWAPFEEIPEQYTCDGDDLSPPLVISQIPPGTVELAIVVLDKDANDFVHWVIAGIDPSTTFIPAGAVPIGAVQAQASNGDIAWVGPCPPPGSGLHTYEFWLYALVEPSLITDGQDAASAIARLDDLAVARSQYVGTYER